VLAQEFALENLVILTVLWSILQHWWIRRFCSASFLKHQVSNIFYEERALDPAYDSNNAIFIHFHHYLFVMLRDFKLLLAWRCKRLAFSDRRCINCCELAGESELEVGQLVDTSVLIQRCHHQS
jgi:hypothetical protein